MTFGDASGGQLFGAAVCSCYRIAPAMMSPYHRLFLLTPLAALTVLVAAAPTAEAKKAKPSCPEGMQLVNNKYCVDQYEASVVEVVSKKKTRSHPHYLPVTDLRVRAVSKKGVFPQGYISQEEAAGACKEAGKRLCSQSEWLMACKGSEQRQFPYGNERHDGYCNDTGLSPLNHFFGESYGEDRYTWVAMNDPRLNQLAGGLGKTGARKKCKSKAGIFDMVGNLHEWTSESGGTFRGGYFLDTKINGEGCDYKTTAHNTKYHDYSTGFRCCKDAK